LPTEEDSGISASEHGAEDSEEDYSRGYFSLTGIAFSIDN